MDERMLIEAAARGDRDAFSALVRLHQARLRALVALTVPGRDDVYDIVQEAFIDAWRGLATFDQSREFAPWLRSVCRHRMHKFLRARAGQRRRELALVDEALLETAPPEETGWDSAPRLVTALRTCLDSLDEAHRRLLSLRFHDAVPVKDIAAQLGKSANGISMTLIRLKAALQKCMAARVADPGGGA